MDRTTATNYATDSNGHRIFQDRNLSTGQPGTTQAAADHTAYQEEILGPIEYAGITPSATYNKQLLQALLALFGVYVADSGSVNALVVAPSPALVSIAEPLRLRVKPAYTNTGASAITVNGVGPIAIVNAAGQPLSGGEMVAGYQVELLYSAAASSFVLAAPAYAAANSFRNMAVFTISGATLNGSAISWTNGGLWTVPPGVTRIGVRGVGGGGGSAAFISGNASMPACGAGGGYFEGRYTVVPTATYAVTVGAGGAGGTSGSSAGSTGSTTSFGSLATGIGGGGGVNGATPAGGTGGTASGGQINVQGGDGTDGLYIGSTTTSTNVVGGPGLGGSTPLGNGGRSGEGGGFPGRGYGGGGGAPYNGGATTYAGAAGAPGIVIVEY
jgi:hypothetical protein